MLLAEELNKIPNWSLKWDINRWCDYIELRCLGGKDRGKKTMPVVWTS